MLREQRFETFSDFYNTDTSFSKLICECESCIELINDNYDNVYYEESGDKQKGIIQTIIEKIGNAISTLAKKISEFFTGKKTESIESKIKNNPELAKETVEIMNYNELSRESQKALKEVDSAKDSESINNAKTKFNKKRAAIIGTATVVTVAAGVGIVKKISADNKSNDNELKKIKKEIDNKETEARKEKYSDLTREKMMAKLDIISKATRDAIASISDFNGKVSKADKEKIKKVHSTIEHNKKLKQDIISANKNLSNGEKFKLREKEVRKASGYHNSVAINKEGYKDYQY